MHPSRRASERERAVAVALRSLTPEFRNRIDEIVVFDPLTRGQADRILGIYLRRASRGTGNGDCGIQHQQARHARLSSLRDSTNPRVLVLCGVCWNAESSGSSRANSSHPTGAQPTASRSGTTMGNTPFDGFARMPRALTHCRKCHHCCCQTTPPAIAVQATPASCRLALTRNARWSMVQHQQHPWSARNHLAPSSRRVELDPGI